MVEIAHERPEDVPHIDALIDVCFGPGRFAKTAYRLREGVNPVPELSYVAYEDKDLRGSLRFWPVMIGPMKALLLGPVVVQHDQRGRGIGIMLMEKAIAEAKVLGHRLIVLVGDEPYYAKVGFKPVPKGQMTMPGPVNLARLLYLELVEGALAEAKGVISRPVPDIKVAASSAPVVVA